MHWSSTLNESKLLKQLVKNRIIVFNTIRSTNQYIMDNLQYIQSGDVFVTDHQTHGRGRYGKHWITPSAQGIALSMYWKIHQKLLITVELGIIVSFVVAKVLEKFGVSRIKIKWPNDLYVYDRKLAGILVEIITKNNYISHVIIGIGINVAICTCTKPTMKIDKNWIDLKNIGVFLNCNMLVVHLVEELRLVMKHFECNNRSILFTMYYSKDLDYLHNKSVVLLFNGYIRYGIVAGMSTNGSLLVIDQSGIVYRYFKDDISVYKI